MLQPKSFSFERNMNVSAWSLTLWQTRGNHCCPKPSAPLVMHLQTLPPAHLGKQSHSQVIFACLKKKLLHVERNSPVICVSHKCPEVLWETLPWGTENLGQVMLSVASGICHMLGCICLNCGGSCCLFLHDVYIRIFFFTSVNIVVFFV